MLKSKSNNQYSKTPWWKAATVEVLIIVGGLAMVNGIFIAKAFRESTTVDRGAAGQLGEFVGGYVGSIFALTGVVLLYRTLRKQSQASKEQSFETKYFELIKMHRDNVAELSLRGERGRKLFVLFIRELRCALEIIQSIVRGSPQQLTQSEMLHVAYYCLFFGV